ncbi:bifunctional tRNA (5-methylaminomethyl-2-thiouridine)(34)-methyltransferase MnmD/FAD-dependent 5-carboxymethylaminomethyl-2-thiouridine(34) oxidoreductase MnmC [Paraburkholderia caballeronis]|uniref:bifunctional tRNA (5-methylaminomethyl-2-thiouridine)(34)-methyltransferase MnmD/FAD-dependent 5-carboxymethylaminomethyl-2-thiouridine(34) oxidoreductase MnmC n=1 Tax=Paraburkholderia caballeronis TaxID=416943 RepID=UPI001064AE08|nr:bifunctional tRNA (5-methylaminomethyl-2-thiouridine)(34)-methyltransferase MnmD/FAD-dependent 5-carboxymethylaminomethyl-2-thiouridine(34) oxidoreductase MnmC [Paraburkholderia caballeronis]TDV11051.1 tRNA 5-methylaminomethyl-2-thiouridine biosynthesis bifunctional protein [Paraburkholderia caballeronis]TDV14259.1 tRNA 5-methylaminomethyl-2-thiouridine biosynthesis bifunctional protein [Paraburkholderia caballeronis]TDV23424.1 tRNA 5-methylaminomethyl-2-thiouridine biosynthesis bifunctional 
MTTTLIPAELAFRDDGTPFSPVYGDIYHSASGAFAQSHYVFLHGNGLPERWHGRRIFTVMETGFGIGVNFLATWSAWRDDPARCERLHFVSIEKHPFARDDLRAVLDAVTADSPLTPLARELVDRWPMLVPGTHRLEFDGGRVTLTLAFGDAPDLLPKLWLRADAFYLDGFAPSKNPDLWSPAVFKALARVAGEHATFATWSSSGDVKRALEQNGFEYRKVDGFGTKHTMLVGRFAPRWRVRRYEPPLPLAADDRHAIVIGAGLAGCAIVERLAARGWRTTLIERHAAPAREASGNPAGVFHPLISRDDSSASRITRAGFLYALQSWAALEARGHAPVRGSGGLLHLATDDEARAVAAALRSFGYPSDYVQPVTREHARQIAGVDVAHDGWFYPHGGWIEPASLCRASCAAAGDALDARFGVRVERLERSGDEWVAFDEHAREIARAPVVVFANAHDAARVGAFAFAPTRIVRGQLTLVANSPLANLRVPVIGDGYAVPRPNGVTLAGATYEVDDADDALRDAGHVENIERVASMLPDLRDALNATRSEAPAGRVAFRCVTSDRLPMLGALADEQAAARDAERLRGAWPLDLPRAPGLYGAFAYGSRGLVWSALGAELVASQIEGEPWPLERELADHVDPARFLQRALRQRTI